MTDPITQLDQDIESKEARRLQRAFGLFLIQGILTLVASGIIFIQSFFSGGSPTYAILGLSMGMVIIAAAFISRRGYAGVGFSIVSVLLFVLVLFFSSRVSDIGLAMGWGSSILFALIGSQILSPQYIQRAIILCFSGGAILVIVNLFWPFERALVNPIGLTITNITMAIIVSIAAFFAWRRFPRYSLQAKLVSVTIAVVIIIVVITTVVVSRVVRNALTENLNRQFSLAAEAQAAAASELLAREIEIVRISSNNSTLVASAITNNLDYDDEASATAQIEEIASIWYLLSNDDPRIFTTVNGFASNSLRRFQENYPLHKEVFITDAHGAVAAATARTENYYYGDTVWWQTAYNNGEGGIFISDPIFDEERDALVLQMAVPIHDSPGSTVNGVFFTIYDMEQFLELLETSADIGATGHTDLIVGARQLHFGEEDTLHAPVLEDGHGNKPHLQNLDLDDELRTQLFSGRNQTVLGPMEGVLSVINVAPITTSSRVETIDLLGWSILVHQSEAEAFAPVKSQERINILLGIGSVIIGSVAAAYIGRLIANPIQGLTQVAQRVAEGDFSARAAVESQDEIGVLATTFNSMTEQLEEAVANLEGRVAERTRALAISAQVSRSLSTILDKNELVKAVVHQVQEAFNYYHVHIYLIDEREQKLIMAGGTGNVGAQMLAAEHSIPMGQGLVGRAAATGSTVHIFDVTRETGWLPNPLLQETKAEISVPITIGERVLGVLDVQQNVTGELTAADEELLQSITYQVAVALRNAEFYEQAQQQAQQQALINEIGQKIQSTNDLQSAMKVAIRELGRATRASKARVKLGTGPLTEPHNGHQQATKEQES